MPRTGTSPPFASRRDRLSDSAGGSASSRISVRVLPDVVTLSASRVPLSAPLHFDRPGAGIERELERPKREVRVDLRSSS